MKNVTAYLLVLFCMAWSTGSIAEETLLTSGQTHYVTYDDPNYTSGSMITHNYRFPLDGQADSLTIKASTDADVHVIPGCGIDIGTCPEFRLQTLFGGTGECTVPLPLVDAFTQQTVSEVCVNVYSYGAYDITATLNGGDQCTTTLTARGKRSMRSQTGSCVSEDKLNLTEKLHQYDPYSYSKYFPADETTPGFPIARLVGCGPLAIARVLAYHNKKYQPENGDKFASLVFQIAQDLDFVYGEKVTPLPTGGGYTQTFTTWDAVDNVIKKLQAIGFKFHDEFTAFGQQIGSESGSILDRLKNYYRGNTLLSEQLRMKAFFSWVKSQISPTIPDVPPTPVIVMSEGHAFVINGYREDGDNLYVNVLWGFSPDTDAEEINLLDLGNAAFTKAADYFGDFSYDYMWAFSLQPPTPTDSWVYPTYQELLSWGGCHLFPNQRVQIFGDFLPHWTVRYYPDSNYYLGIERGQNGVYSMKIGEELKYRGTFEHLYQIAVGDTTVCGNAITK